MQQSNRSFGLTIGGAFIALAVIGYFFSGKIIAWLVGVGVIFALLGLTGSYFLAPIKRAWMALGQKIGIVGNFVVLGIVYLGVFTTFAWVMRLIGRDHMRLKPSSADSHWIVVDQKVDRQNLRDMF